MTCALEANILSPFDLAVAAFSANDCMTMFKKVLRALCSGIVCFGLQGLGCGGLLHVVRLHQLSHVTSASKCVNCVMNEAIPAPYLCQTGRACQDFKRGVEGVGLSCGVERVTWAACRSFIYLHVQAAGRVGAGDLCVQLVSNPCASELHLNTKSKVGQK